MYRCLIAKTVLVACLTQTCVLVCNIIRNIFCDQLPLLATFPDLRSSLTHASFCDKLGRAPRRSIQNLHRLRRSKLHDDTRGKAALADH